MMRTTTRRATLAVVLLAGLLASSGVQSAPKLRLFETFSSKVDPGTDAPVPAPSPTLPHLTPHPEPDALPPPEILLPLAQGKTSDLVVKVLDLPDRPEFRRLDGSYFDLGWRFKGKKGGAWVGYIGSSTDFLNIPPQELANIMRLANLSVLPQPPRRLTPPARPQATPRGIFDAIPLLGMAMSLVLTVVVLRYLARNATNALEAAARGLVDWARTHARRPDGKPMRAPAGPDRSPMSPGPAARPSPTAAAAARRPTVVRRAPTLFSRLS